MAETITFRVGINPRVETVTETAREGGSVDEVIPPSLPSNNPDLNSTLKLNDYG